MISTDFNYAYRNFTYKHVTEDSPYVLWHRNKAVTSFEEYHLLTDFVDRVYETIELHPVYKDFRLHLTGCMRCKRSAETANWNPCKTGKLKFEQTNSFLDWLLAQFVQEIENDRKNDEQL